MASRFNIPITQLVNDDASDIASGWMLNFYSTGTTTRKDTFSDNPLSTANANPVVADSAGRFGDIFLESGDYKVVLTDENAVEKWTADPIAGSVGSSGAVDEKTSAYTLTIDDATKIISVDATSGAVTITLLPAATAGEGFVVAIKKTDSSSNAVTIDGDGAETIDGSATFSLPTQYEVVSIRSDGANWVIETQKRELQLNSVDGTMIAVGSDAAADILTHDGTDYVRLPKGTGLQRLRMNSGATALEWVTNAPDFTSSQQSVDVDTILPVPHGLGVKPTLVRVSMICTTDNQGYVAATFDEVINVGFGAQSVGGDGGVTIFVDATNVTLVQGSAIVVHVVSTFNIGNITTSSWRWIVRAWL